MEEELKDAINNYYKMKQHYESKNLKVLERKKNEYENKNYSRKKMKNLIKKQEFECINCKRVGGSIFKVDGKSLIAKCGVKESPCNLNINIERSDYIPYDRILYKPNILYEKGLHEEIRLIKEQIMKLKLDIIFKLDEDKVILAKFDKLKDNLNDLNLHYMEYEAVYEMLRETYIDNQLIDSKIRERNEYIKSIKIILNEYESTSNIKYLKEIVDIYHNNLVPTIEELFKTMYSSNVVEKLEGLEGKNHHYELYQRHFNYHQTEIAVYGDDYSKIVSNIYKIKV